MDQQRGLVPSTDSTGTVVTVTGPISPDELGVSIMHEHLFVDLRKNHLPHQKLVSLPGITEPILTTEDFPATELALWEAKLGVGNLHLALDREPIADNYVLADVDLAIQEVTEFKNHGGNTIVDVTSMGLKRAPLALRQVSEATGVNIVMGTGWYTTTFHPYDMDQRTVEEITDEIVADVTVGVGDTGVRSGIIGEIGINGAPITPNETKSIRAAARACMLTGAPISFHRGGEGAEISQTLTTVAEEGADLARVILGHADLLASDLPLMVDLLQRGVYIQFDLLGRPATLTPSATVRVAEAIPQLIDAGYGDRILLSHDVCWKIHLKKYGGFGYSFILEKFLPHLRETGVTEHQINEIMVENPKRVLPFVEPQ